MRFHRNLLIAAGAVSLAAVMTPCGVAQAQPDSDQPQTRGIYLQMIQKARVDGRSRAAMAYLDDYDHKYPGDVEARVLRINCLLDLHQVAEAQACWAACRPNAPDALPRSSMRSTAMCWRRRTAGATRFRITPLRLRPIRPRQCCATALGYAQLRDHHPDRALETISDARELAPDDMIIRNNLMLAYAINGAMHS